jgi:hypothetical protein
MTAQDMGLGGGESGISSLLNANKKKPKARAVHRQELNEE